MNGTTDRRWRILARVIASLAAFAALGVGAYAATGTAAIRFTKASLLNGWKHGNGNHGAADTAAPGYAKDSLGIVHLRGGLRGGASGQEAFVLPQTLAPAHETFLPLITYASTPGGLVVSSGGQVIPIGSPRAFTQLLDGMSFVARHATKIKFTSATLQNGWRYGGHSSAHPGYAIDPLGVVHLHGGLAGTSTDTTAFVLPKAFRPSHPMWLPIYTSAGTEGSLEVTSTGPVIPFGSNATSYASLDGISFVAGRATKIKFTNAKLLNNWTDGGYGSAQPAYAKDSLGVVHLQGAVQGQQGSFDAFTLPKALRPTHNLYFPIYTFDGTEGMLEILTTGEVRPFGSDVQDYTSLDGISFVAGQ